MTTPTKTLDAPNVQVLHHLIYHAIKHSLPFGAAISGGHWTLAVPADRYGEFLRLRNTLTAMENNNDAT